MFLTIVQQLYNDKYYAVLHVLGFHLGDLGYDVDIKRSPVEINTRPNLITRKYIKRKTQ